MVPRWSVAIVRNTLAYASVNIGEFTIHHPLFCTCFKPNVK